MNALSIGNLTIHQDEHGRYSLNDLHKAAGAAQHHRPSKWMANKQTLALIGELDSENESRIRALESHRL